MYHSNDKICCIPVRHALFVLWTEEQIFFIDFESGVFTNQFTHIPMFTTNLNKDLYGPARISARTGIKDILLRDHVLQEGEWHSENEHKNPWKTSFSISYEVGASQVFS